MMTLARMTTRGLLLRAKRINRTRNIIIINNRKPIAEELKEVLVLHILKKTRRIVLSFIVASQGDHDFEIQGHGRIARIIGNVERSSREQQE